jgi:hypothetical protein
MSATIHAGHMVAPLLLELKNSDRIIIAMLNAMTTAQKSKVHARLDAAGVSGEGMTRHHERRAVIDAAEAATVEASIGQAQSTSAPQRSSAEIQLVAAFRAMDNRSRETKMSGALRRAIAYPRRTAPVLRLVVGGAS